MFTKAISNPPTTDVPELIKSANRFCTSGPSLPAGAHIYSALVLWHRSTGANSRVTSRNEVYGKQGASPVNWFAAGAGAISAGYFGGERSPQTVLKDHSLFGFYGRGLSGQVAARWQAQLIEGNGRSLQEFVASSVAIGATGGLRWCAACLAQDISEMGIGLWHSIHQVPYVLICPVHGMPLQSACKTCSEPLDRGGKYRLPGDSCLKRGSHKFSILDAPQSISYRLLVSDSYDLFMGRSEIILGSSWSKELCALIGGAKDLAEIQAAVAKDVVCEFGQGVLAPVLFPRNQRGRRPALEGIFNGSQVKYSVGLRLLCGRALKTRLIAKVSMNSSDSRVRQQQEDGSNGLTGLSANGREIPGCADARSELTNEIEAVSDGRVNFSNLDRFDLRRSTITRIRRKINEFEKSQPHRFSENHTAGRGKRYWSLDQKRQAYRLRVKELLLVTPDMTRSDLYKKVPEITMWLRRDDEAWLDLHVPKRRSSA